jgi:hypothetical protein
MVKSKENVPVNTVGSDTDSLVSTGGNSVI